MCPATGVVLVNLKKGPKCFHKFYDEVPTCSSLDECFTALCPLSKKATQLKEERGEKCKFTWQSWKLEHSLISRSRWEDFGTNLSHSRVVFHSPN